MTNYLIVVPRGNTELFDLLSVAFRGHTGFHVVIDRRGSDSREDPAASLDEPERRGARLALGPDEIVVAERADRADRPTGGVMSRPVQRVPVRRRRARPAASGPAGASARQPAPGPHGRSATAW
jgi:hypothetical protein